jgi:hypothetical protein
VNSPRDELTVQQLGPALSEEDAIDGGMTNSRSSLQALSSFDLLTRTRELVHKSSDIEGELLVHLAEIDERKLYLECAFPSMFVRARDSP